MNMKIINLRENPDMQEEMAQWFHEKWGIPLEAYLESMEECLVKKNGVPQWYVAMKEGKIIGGLGVIENDFHDRKDLTPNVCAVYVEQTHRCKGIAGALLNFACDDMRQMGVAPLFLLTDHTGFYERYDWEFFCMVQGDGESEMARMYIHR